MVRLAFSGTTAFLLLLRSNSRRRRTGIGVRRLGNRPNEARSSRSALVNLGAGGSLIRRICSQSLQDCSRPGLFPAGESPLLETNGRCGANLRIRICPTRTQHIFRFVGVGKRRKHVRRRAGLRERRTGLDGLDRLFYAENVADRHGRRQRPDDIANTVPSRGRQVGAQFLRNSVKAARRSIIDPPGTAGLAATEIPAPQPKTFRSEQASSF